MLKKNYQQQREKGFSLLEVMVAVSLIIVGLLGALLLISRSFSGGAVSASLLVAANLAQEGIEVVKNIRDLSYAADGSWDNWYADFSGGTYSVQYDSVSLGGLAGNYLRYNSANGLYSYTAGENTAFRRQIILTKISDEEVRVQAVVTWVEQNQPQSLTVEDHLWNWR